MSLHALRTIRQCWVTLESHDNFKYNFKYQKRWYMICESLVTGKNPKNPSNLAGNTAYNLRITNSKVSGPPQTISRPYRLHPNTLFPGTCVTVTWENCTVNSETMISLYLQTIIQPNTFISHVVITDMLWLGDMFLRLFQCWWHAHSMATRQSVVQCTNKNINLSVWILWRNN